VPSAPGRKERNRRSSFSKLGAVNAIRGTLRAERFRTFAAKLKAHAREGRKGQTEEEMQRHDPAAPSPVMTSKEVAEYLRIHQATLSKLVRRGEIPGFKIGRDYRFRRDQIDKWMAEKSGLQEISK